MGHVLSGGCGQAPAKQAALGADIPSSVPCTGVNKVCSSGMKAVSLGAAAIALGHADIVVAGGMESMSNAPYLLPDARGGMRYGNKTVVDSCALDGLTDPYGDVAMGVLAEACAETYSISREEQDAYAIQSYQRALAARQAGAFDGEIVPVVCKSRKGEVVVETDDEPARFAPEKIPNLRTVFKAQNGSVTAGNASTISDGAAALVLASPAKAQELGLTVYATIEGFADAAKDPAEFTTAPSLAVPAACKRAGIQPTDADLVEINEAFAVVALANISLLGLDPEKVNVNGGAVSIGHPLGCSGARIIVTLIHALHARGGKLGVAGVCNGGGGASAIVVKVPESE